MASGFVSKEAMDTFNIEVNAIGGLVTSNFYANLFRADSAPFEVLMSEYSRKSLSKIHILRLMNVFTKTRIKKNIIISF